MQRGLLNFNAANEETQTKRGLGEKFKKAQSQWTAEKELGKITPLKGEKKRAVETWFTSRIAEAEQVNPEAKQAYETWRAFRHHSELDETIDADFMKDFVAWLLGRGKEDDHKITPWKRNVEMPKLPTVRAWLDTFLEEKKKVEVKLIELQMRGPKTLNEAYLYFKYLIRPGMAEDDSLILQDFDRFAGLHATGFEVDADKEHVLQPTGVVTQGTLEAAQALTGSADGSEHSKQWTDRIGHTTAKTTPIFQNAVQPNLNRYKDYFTEQMKDLLTMQIQQQQDIQTMLRAQLTTQEAIANAKIAKAEAILAGQAQQAAQQAGAQQAAQQAGAGAGAPQAAQQAAQQAVATARQQLTNISGQSKNLPPPLVPQADIEKKLDVTPIEELKIQLAALGLPTKDVDELLTKQKQKLYEVGRGVPSTYARLAKEAETLEKESQQIQGTQSQEIAKKAGETITEIQKSQTLLKDQALVDAEAAGWIKIDANLLTELQNIENAMTAAQKTASNQDIVGAQKAYNEKNKEIQKIIQEVNLESRKAVTLSKAQRSNTQSDIEYTQQTLKNMGVTMDPALETEYNTVLAKAAQVEKLPEDDLQERLDKHAALENLETEMEQLQQNQKTEKQRMETELKTQRKREKAAAKAKAQAEAQAKAQAAAKAKAQAGPRTNKEQIQLAEQAASDKWTQQAVTDTAVWSKHKQAVTDEATLTQLFEQVAPDPSQLLELENASKNNPGMVAQLNNYASEMSAVLRLLPPSDELLDPSQQKKATLATKQNTLGRAFASQPQDTPTRAYLKAVLVEPTLVNNAQSIPKSNDNSVIGSPRVVQGRALNTFNQYLGYPLAKIDIAADQTTLFTELAAKIQTEETIHPVVLGHLIDFARFRPSDPTLDQTTNITNAQDLLRDIRNDRNIAIDWDGSF